jgi:hypothetical protein
MLFFVFCFWGGGVGIGGGVVAPAATCIYGDEQD